MDDETRGCSGYCGNVATTVVEGSAATLRRNNEGHLVYEVIDPPVRIPVCNDCQAKAIAGELNFTYCAADDHWGRTAFECRGGCGRRLVGWILEAPAVPAPN
jgi:hypothetical protein